MINHSTLYIDGKWVVPAEPGDITVINPATEQILGHAVSGGVSDVDRAVAAAREAFPGWSQRSAADRREAVLGFAAALERRSGEMAELLTAEVGAPLSLARDRQVPGPIAQLRLAADNAEAVLAAVPVGNSQVFRAAAGVVAAIAPWNFPLLLGMNKIAPALAVGCTVVFKPSEVTPLHAFLLAEIAHDSGLPAGVLNLVTGSGAVVGEALAGHPGVDVVSLTGSTAAGRKVAAAATGTIKKVHLELGGKSASVVLAGADLRMAVEATVEQCFINSGQTCLAWSRLLVPAGVASEAAQIAATRADRYVLGDPLDPATELGPVVSVTQRACVRAAIDRAIRDDARLVTGGTAAPDGLNTGYYVRPTVFADVDPRSDLGQEEVFGPVLAVIGYNTEADAVAIANGTPYGLHGAVFAANNDQATRVARQLRTGAVDINGGTLNLEAPFGGYKQSGVGRELGRWGLEEYTEITSLQY